MADRKKSDEPSLFDLPLRGQAGSGASRDGAGTSPPEGAQAGRSEPAPEERPFWEEEDDTRDAADRPATPPPAGLFDDEASREETTDGVWAERPAAPENARAESEAPGGATDGAADGAAAAGLADGWEEPPPLPDLAQPVPAPWTPRLAASLLDGGLLLVVTAAAIFGAYLLGVRWDAADLPALGMFLLVFSFVYSVMPLAFWGRTPGMALARLLSRGADGGPLTFGQTALRWLGGLVTVAFAGLPLLLALPGLGGRSLADRLSGSHTWLQPDA